MTRNVTKGKLRSITGQKAEVALEESGSSASIKASMHPKSSRTVIPIGSTVFVSRPFASDLSVNEYEIIGFATQQADSKTVSTKWACVHPERASSDVDKLCKNCPRRTVHGLN